MSKFDTTNPPRLLPYWRIDDKDYCSNIWKWPPTFEVPDVLANIPRTPFQMNREEFKRFCDSQKELLSTPEASTPAPSTSSFPAFLKDMDISVDKTSADDPHSSDTDSCASGDGSGARDTSEGQVVRSASALAEYEAIMRNMETMDADNTNLISRRHTPPPMPTVSRSDLLFGATYGDLHDLYVHVRGYSDIPESLEKTGLAIAIHLRVLVLEEDFVKFIEDGTRLNMNNLVYWGLFCDRSISSLLSAVAPKSYNVSTTKQHLLKYARGEMMKDYGADSSSEVKCQACRSMLKDFEGLVKHLLRKTDEMTYMCKHCGFLKFTNFCAFLYHIFSDATSRPIYRFCIACSRYQESMERHLTGNSTYFDSWRVKCKYCSYIAFSTCAFTFHLSLHIKELPYICTDCGEFFLFKEALGDHMNKTCHYQYKFRLFLCKVCHLIFSHVKQFTTHISLKHYERRLSCLLCSEIFCSKPEFFFHRNTAHPNSQFTYQIHYHCDLCPNSTFRGLSREKHLANHAEEDMCQIVLYKCSCNYYALVKEKFLKHLGEDNCDPKTLDRPYILKMCMVCDELKAYNNTDDPFVCEACEIHTVPQICLVSYYCSLCHFILNYDWDEVLDHFADYHARFDLMTVGDKILIIVGENIVRQRYLKRPMKLLEYDQFVKLIMSQCIPTELVQRKIIGKGSVQSSEPSSPVESPVFSTLLANQNEVLRPEIEEGPAQTIEPPVKSVFSTLLAKQIQVLGPEIINTRIDGTRIPAATETTGEDSLDDDVEQILLYDPESIEEEEEDL